MTHPMTADTPAASKDRKAMPTKPGYYWAKWRIAADGTHEGDELTPSDFWGIVEVNENAPGRTLPRRAASEPPLTRRLSGAVVKRGA